MKSRVNIVMGLILILGIFATATLYNVPQELEVKQIEYSISKLSRSERTADTTSDRNSITGNVVRTSTTSDESTTTDSDDQEESPEQYNQRVLDSNYEEEDLAQQRTELTQVTTQAPQREKKVFGFFRNIFSAKKVEPSYQQSQQKQDSPSIANLGQGAGDSLNQENAIAIPNSNLGATQFNANDMDISVQDVEDAVVSGKTYVYRWYANGPGESGDDEPFQVMGIDTSFLPVYKVYVNVNTNYAIKKVHIEAPQDGKLGISGTALSTTNNAPSYLKECVGKTSCEIEHYMFPSEAWTKEFGFFSQTYESDYADYCAPTKPCSQMPIRVKFTLTNGETVVAKLDKNNGFYFSSADWSKLANKGSGKKGLDNYYKNTEDVSSLGAHIAGDNEHSMWLGLCDCQEENYNLPVEQTHTVAPVSTAQDAIVETPQLCIPIDGSYKIIENENGAFTIVYNQ